MVDGQEPPLDTSDAKAFAGWYIKNRRSNVARELGQQEAPVYYDDAAYEYLIRTWNNWNNANKGSEGHIAEEKDKQEKLITMLDGLTHYFRDIDEVQESLIKVSTDAARQVLIAESLLVTLDRNLRIKEGDVASLKAEISATLRAILHRPKSIVDHMLNDVLADHKPEEMPGEEAKGQAGAASEQAKLAGLLEKVSATLNAPNVAAHADAAVALRDEIYAWLKELDYPGFNEMEDYTEAVARFRGARTERTQALDEYQNALIQAKEEFTAEQLRVQSTFKSPPTGLDYTDIIKRLEERIAEVSEFRDGKIEYLSPQYWRFGRLNPPITDLEEIFHRRSAMHPLANMLNNMQEGLNILTEGCGIAIHQDNPPAGIFEEHGKKSWVSAIDKLVWNYDGDWNLFHDLARIKFVSSKAYNMFLFNQIMRDMIEKQAWVMKGPNEKGKLPRDRGPLMEESGRENWIMHVKIGNYQGEIQIVDAVQNNVEHIGHALYAASRKMENGRHQFNAERITLEGCKTLCGSALKTVNDLLRSGNFPSQLKEHLEETEAVIRQALQEIEIAAELASVIGAMQAPEQIIMDMLTRQEGKEEIQRWFDEHNMGSENTILCMRLMNQPSDMLTKAATWLDNEIRGNRLKEIHDMLDKGQAITYASAAHSDAPKTPPSAAALYDRTFRELIERLITQVIKDITAEKNESGGAAYQIDALEQIKVAAASPNNLALHDPERLQELIRQWKLAGKETRILEQMAGLDRSGETEPSEKFAYAQDLVSGLIRDRKLAGKDTAILEKIASLWETYRAAGPAFGFHYQLYHAESSIPRLMQRYRESWEKPLINSRT